MRRWLSAWGFYFPVQWVRGVPARRALRELARIRQDSIGAHRVASVTRLLSNLWDSPYYAALLEKTGFEPRAHLGPDALAQLPVLSKEAVRAHADEMEVPGVAGDVRKTSGSTGIPLRFQKDHWSTAMMDALMYERYGWYGVRLGDRQARIWGSALNGRARLSQRVVDYGMNRRRLSSFDLSTRSIDRYVDELTRFQAEFIYTYPGALKMLTDLASDTALDRLRQLPLRALICTGEMLYPWHRERFAEVFDAPVVNEYGSTENGVIGFECHEGTLHASSELLWLEVVDAHGAISDTGRGQLLVTELYSRSIPFVRYALGDLVELDDRACACGRSGQLLRSVEGRQDAFIVLADGRRVYDAILAYSLGGHVDQFRAVQSAPGALDIEVVPRADGFSDARRDVVLRDLRARLGKNFEVTFRVVDAVRTEPSGKLRYFVPLPDDNSDVPVR